LIGVEDAERRVGEQMATKTNAKNAKTRAPAKPKKAGLIPETAAEEKTQKRKEKSALVRKLLDAAEKKVTAEDVKASIGDVIRLLQLQKELEEEEPREIKVQWIEREDREHASEK